MRKIPHIRWWVAGLLFGAAVLNYIDRQTLSILAPTIQADLKLDDYAYARVVNLFLVAYTIALVGRQHAYGAGDERPVAGHVPLHAGARRGG